MKTTGKNSLVNSKPMDIHQHNMPGLTTVTANHIWGFLCLDTLTLFLQRVDFLVTVCACPGVITFWWCFRAELAG